MVVCPKCRSDRTAPILYGYPSHEAFEAEERGELILGGCEMECHTRIMAALTADTDGQRKFFQLRRLQKYDIRLWRMVRVR